MFSKKTNIEDVTGLLLRRLKVKVSNFTVKHDLSSHPDYPSLMSVSDCLSSWNISNEAFKVDKNRLNYSELPLPFIARLNTSNGTLVLVENIQGKEVVIADRKKDRRSLSIGEFIRDWDGTFLYAEGNEISGEEDYKQSVLKGLFFHAKLPFLALVVICGIFVAIDAASLNLSYTTALSVNFAGILVSIMLLINTIGSGNPFIQNLCSLGKKNDCNAILKSDSANITSWLSWSEIGLFYFSGSFLSLLFRPDSIVLLNLINLLCLPYTVYSIGYQLKNKSWCILCCAVQGLLWLGFFNYCFYDDALSFSGINFTMILSSILAFSFPIATWAVIKPFLIDAQQVVPLKRQLKQFKYNTGLFTKILENQPKYTIPEDLMPIAMGNPEGSTVITMVSNPFCGPCSKAHQSLEMLIKHRDDLKLNIVFATSDQDDEKRTKVARHVTALGLSEDKDLVKTALNDWYNQTSKNYEDWAEKYPVTFGDNLTASSRKQKEWCDLAEITFTPTILINGYKLIEPYQIEDMKYLLD